MNSLYDQITRVDIGAVARELIPERITRTVGSELHCDCPHHESQSKESLHVSLEKQNWICFGCDKGGDVIHFAEFCLTGDVSKGVGVSSRPSHKEAIDWLAKYAGIDLAVTSRNSEHYDEQQRVFGTLQTVLKHYHLAFLQNPQVQEWFYGFYSITKEAVARLGIGFADNRQLGSLGCSEDQLLECGILTEDRFGRRHPFFDGRITFPYWSRGNMIYAIGRQTPWTPEHKWEVAKYKKLPVKNDKRPYVSAQIRNDLLYNEDCLQRRPPAVIWCEGITDAISTIERGLDVISPVTLRAQEAHIDRAAKMLDRSQTVYLVPDNEASGTGMKGAIANATAMRKKGIVVAIVELPLFDQHKRARKQLEDWKGQEHTDGAELARVTAQAKVDLNEYFRFAEMSDFQSLLKDAQDPLAFEIQQVSEGDTQRIRLMLRRIDEEADPLNKDKLISKLAKQVKRKKRDIEQELPKASRKSEAKALIDMVLERVGGPQSFFCDPSGEAFGTFDGVCVPIDNRRFQHVLRLTWNKRGMSTILKTTTVGDVQKECLAIADSNPRKEVSLRSMWLEKDVLAYRLSAKSCAIVKPDGWTISEIAKVAPGRFAVSPSSEDLPAPRQNNRDIWELLCPLAPQLNDDNIHLLLGFLLSSMSPTGPYPIGILTGHHGTGKSTVTRIITKLVDPTGEPLAPPKEPTDIYVSARNRHLVSYDNVTFIDGELSDALCRLATGAALSRRKLFSDSDEELLKASRPVLLNSINQSVTRRPDLMDRALPIFTLPLENRITERQFWGDFEQRYPYLMGRLLDGLVCAVKWHQEHRQLRFDLRMADSAAWIWGASEAYGLSDQIVQSWAEQLGEAKETQLAQDPVCIALQGLIASTQTIPCTFSAAQLLTRLRTLSNDASMPKTAAALGRMIGRIETELYRIGIVIRHVRRQNKRMYEIDTTDEYQRQGHLTLIDGGEETAANGGS